MGYKEPPTLYDATETRFLTAFCRDSKCPIHEMVSGKKPPPFGRTASSMKDTCVGNCQRSAKDLAVWLVRGGFRGMHAKGLKLKPKLALPAPSAKRGRHQGILSDEPPGRY